MDIKILTNYDDDLWCIECKQKIQIGEKFGILYEVYNNELIEKCYHCTCLPEEDEDLIIDN